MPAPCSTSGDSAETASLNDPCHVAAPAVQPTESRYVEQLFEAYSEKLAVQLDQPEQLAKHPELERHFNRSREVFYHAESLRNFPRDSVDSGAFDEIRNEIYHGCIDKHDMEYATGWTVFWRPPAMQQR